MNNRGTNSKPYIVVPYVKGIHENCRNICRKHGIEMYLKGGNTIKNLLVHPKDRDTILQKSGVNYRYKCGRVDFEEEYIGESARTFAEKFREHKRPPHPSMMSQHHWSVTVCKNFCIVGREDQSIARAIKEAVLI